MEENSDQHGAIRRRRVAYGWGPQQRTRDWIGEFTLTRSWFGLDPWDASQFEAVQRVSIPVGATCDLCKQRIEPTQSGILVTLDDPTMLIRHWPTHRRCAEEDIAREAAEEPDWHTPFERPTRAVIIGGPYDGQEGLIILTVMPSPFKSGQFELELDYAIEYLVQLDSGVQERFPLDQLRMLPASS